VQIRNENQRRVVVVGIGNVLLKDEGIGVHVARALSKAAQGDNSSFDVIDGGTSPDVFMLLEGARKVVLVDAVSGGGSPGSVYRFHPADILLKKEYTISAHQISLMDSLQMMEFSEHKPEEVVIVGIEPKEIGWGMEPSPELQGKMPQIIKVVLDEVNSKKKEEAS